MTQKVRFVDPGRLYRELKTELDAAYFEVMEKGDLIDRGQLQRFEENLATFVGAKYAVGLNSGYDALHMSLRAAGIGAGDEVIVPAHTFVATCSAVVNVGATPVLVDVADDFNIDVAQNRGGHHAPHEGHHSGAPERLDGRHARRHGHRQPARPDRRRRRVPEPWQQHQRKAGRLVGPHGLLELLPVQDPRRLRRRRRHHDRR